MTAGLAVAGLRAGYGRETALDGVDFEAGAGRLVALAGENGSGKSTLLKAIAGVVPRSTGEIRLGGESIREWPRRKRARAVAYAAQSVDLIFPISVRDLVLQGRAPWRSGFLWESGEDREIAEEAMRACDVLDLAERDATRLSGGERRRAFLARLLAQRAAVWLLDEPTADLDPRHRLEFLEVLREAHARARPIVLWATHDVNEALAIADDLLLLRRGRLVAAGPVDGALAPEALERTFSIGAAVERDAAGRPRVTFFRPSS
ncbi:MAG TPA: ABC transporter ATP-binding protein [Thermoanaerobaculia bacterium]|nr:ABC transporter ATP-binding protein [Thermoanaerobaculia bacterium]